LKSLIKYIKKMPQVIVVLLAFALMDILSFIFMNNVERKHLVKMTEEAFSFTQANILSDLKEPETILGGIAETIRKMILQGSDFNTVCKYITDITQYIFANEELVSDATEIYGVFDVFGGKYHSGINRTFPDNFVPQNRPWYKVAIEANGEIGITEPYQDMSLPMTVITFTRRIFDEKGIPLGIVSLDIKLDRICGFAVNTQLSDGGYGYLMDKNLNIIAHPNPSFLGRNMYEVNSGLAGLEGELRDDRDVFEYTVYNYEGIKTIVSLKKFLNGWYMGIVTPKGKYFRTAYNVAWFLFTLGIVLAVILSAILIRIISAKSEVEERSRFILEAMPLSCCLHDAKLNFIDCNQETLSMFGLSSKQEYYERFFELSPEYQPDGRLSKTRIDELVKRTIEGGYYRFEWTHQKLNGEPIPAEVTLIRVKQRGEYIIVAYIRDLREFMAVMREKSKAEIAEESSKAKSKFLATMSHEIRTPMNAILGITEIQLQNELLPQETKEAFLKINNSGDLLLHIINDILDLSKIDAEKLKLEPVTYNIATLINDIVHLNIIRHDTKPLSFKLYIDENIPADLIGDEFRIRQILNNLLSNAFKYTNEGEIDLSVTAEFGLVNENPPSTIMLIFRVSDTGQGMTAEQVNKLFDEYTRFNFEANRATEGTGLGMSITRHLVRLMNGTISVESEPGKGSVFTVRLPQGNTGAVPLGKEMVESLQHFRLSGGSLMKKAQIVREYMPYGKVLIVDDVETNIYVSKGLMAPYGLLIDTAMSGFEAIDKVKAGNAYDIIFMDHMMPKMDGMEATKIIRGLGYMRSIVALTANAVAGQAEMFLANGFDDFLSKPIDIRQLNIMLNRLIRDKYPPEIVESARRQKENHEKYSSVSRQQSSEGIELAGVFVRDAEKAAITLEGISKNNFRRNDDIQLYVTTIHAMKGALANIGESELSDMALKLERAGRDRNTGVMIAETPEFLNELRAVIEENKISNEENNTVDGDSDESLAFLREKLTVIQAACAEYNKRNAKAALSVLKQKKWSHRTRKLLDDISGHLLHGDFEDAADIAGNYVRLNK